MPGVKVNIGSHEMCIFFEVELSAEYAVCRSDTAGPGGGDSSAGPSTVSHQVNMFRCLEMIIQEPWFIGIEFDLFRRMGII